MRNFLLPAARALVGAASRLISTPGQASARLPMRHARVRAPLLLLAPLALLAWNGVTSKIRYQDITNKARVKVRHHTRIFNGPYADVLRMFTSGGASAAVGDYDNDGYDDIFVTDSDKGTRHHLFHNNHDGTFTDVAEQAGVAGGNEPLTICADALWF